MENCEEELKMFELSKRILDAKAMVETVAIDCLSTAPDEVNGFVLKVISNNVLNTLMVEDEVVDLWNTARDRNQVVVDWIMSTYRQMSLAVGREKVLDHVRECYVNSVDIGDVGELCGDTDLGSRLTTGEEASKLLKDHKWFMVFVALYSIDFSTLSIQ